MNATACVLACLSALFFGGLLDDWAAADGDGDVPGKSPADEPRLQTKVTWYDGGQPRHAWLDPRLLVEVRGERDRAAEVRAAAPGARVLEENSLRRLWLFPSRAGAAAAQKRLATAGVRTYAGLRDGPSERARWRAPSGRLIVRFARSGTETELRRWARGRGLAFVRRQSYDANTCVFDLLKGAGLEPLLLANRLRTESGVRDATPDFWVHVVRRR